MPKKKNTKKKMAGPKKPVSKKKTALRKSVSTKRIIKTSRSRLNTKKNPLPEGLGLERLVMFLSTHLTERGHDPILVGEACAALYAGGTIEPKHIEFVIGDYIVETVCKTMSLVGYKVVDSRTFAHKNSPYEVILSPKPIAVGDDIVTDIKALRHQGTTLRILSATDCVRYMLSMYYRWGDKLGLSYAVKVTKKHKIDMDLVRRWSEWEWCGDRFEEFLRELA